MNDNRDSSGKVVISSRLDQPNNIFLKNFEIVGKKLSEYIIVPGISPKGGVNC